MSRGLSSTVINRLAEGTVQLATCVKVTKKDGTVQGFTSWDSELVLSGVTYTPEFSSRTSAIAATADAGTDSVDLFGHITQNFELEDVLVKLRDAEVEIFKVVLPYEDVIPLYYGRVSQITQQDNTFYLKCSGLWELAKVRVGRATSLVCDYRRFGSSQCNPPGGIAAYRNSVTVSSQTDVTTFTIGAVGGRADGYFARGIIKFTSGNNDGLSLDIKSDTISGGSRILVARSPVPFALVNGDTAVLEAGCDRLASTCRTKFANMTNFGGQDLLPGNDVLLKVGR